MSVTIQQEGRRYYIVGNTYDLRDKLRSAGCHWDGEKRAWWTAKREVADGFIGPAKKQDETVDSARTEIIGKAQYKGHEYLILWEGQTKRGARAAKLCFRDGSKVFWAEEGEYSISKTYREALTVKKLDRLAAEYKEQRAAEEQAAAEWKRQQTAREAKAKESEVTAEERKGLADFTRRGKASVTVGEKTQHTAKDGAVTHYEVVSVGASYYHSEEECEEMDCFCHHYGWKTPYTAREIAATPEQQAAEIQANADAQERADLATALRSTYSADSHLGSQGPQGVIMADLWHEWRMAGSENWYLGSDGIVYRMISDYDSGPNWWCTTATMEQIERAKALGMKAI